MEELKYHKRAYVLAQGISASSLDRWSAALRNTKMVGKLKDGGELVYSDDFVTFMINRMEATGPANLPNPSRIAQLYELIRAGKTIDQIAQETKTHHLIVELQLEAIGAKQ